MSRVSSYTNMSTGGGGWIDAWTDKGSIKVWLHPCPPVARNLHSFRQVVVKDNDNGPSKKIAWLPFVCHEPESYHIALRKERPAQAAVCPMCRFMEYLANSEDLKNDDLIFSFQAGRDRREIVLEDFMGWNANAWEDNATAKSDFLINVIPFDDLEGGPKILQAKYSLVKELQKVIVADIEELGDDGNPEKTPRAYRFSYDKESKRYAVASWNERAKVTDEVRAAWEKPEPDSERFAEGGDPEVLRAAFEAGLVLDNVPLDDIFAPAMELVKKKPKKRDEEDEKDEAAPRREAPARSRAKTTEPPVKPGKDARSTKKAEEEEPPPRRSAKKEEEEPPPRRSAKKEEEEPPPRRSAKKEEEEPPPRRSAKKDNDDDDIDDRQWEKKDTGKKVSCEVCSAVIPADANPCPECGAEFETED